MDSAAKLQASLLKIVDNARFAPSVHNVQPWKVRFDGPCLKVDIDQSISLKHSDPTGRETLISLGIFSEALMIAAAAEGLKTKNVRLVNNQVHIEFEAGKLSQTDKKLLVALRRRCTDRSIYRPTAIKNFMVNSIEKSVRLAGVSVRVVTDRNTIRQAAELTARGIGLALSNPDFRRELSQYLIIPRFEKRGISIFSLHLPLPIALLESKFLKWGWGLKTEVKVERQRWLSASGIIYITTPGDLAKDWFAAGRAYLRTSLAAEQLGLSQATSAATVEASTYHEDIETLLGTKGRLQAATRIGAGSPKKTFSPRVPAEELIVT